VPLLFLVRRVLLFKKTKIVWLEKEFCIFEAVFSEKPNRVQTSVSEHQGA